MTSTDDVERIGRQDAAHLKERQRSKAAQLNTQQRERVRTMTIKPLPAARCTYATGNVLVHLDLDPSARFKVTDADGGTVYVHSMQVTMSADLENLGCVDVRWSGHGVQVLSNGLPGLKPRRVYVGRWDDISSEAARVAIISAYEREVRGLPRTFTLHDPSEDEDMDDAPDRGRELAQHINRAIHSDYL
jgi:hypothetical protein